MNKWHFRSEIKKFDDSLWSYHVIIPEDLVVLLSSDGHKRVICSVDGGELLSKALMPDGNGHYFLMFNKELVNKYALQIGKCVSIEIWKDTSKYGMPIPVEMEELLFQDPKGSDFFHQLTKGKQRSLIYIVDKPKSSELKLKKAMIILDYLKSSNGFLDYKKLNIALKEGKLD